MQKMVRLEKTSHSLDSLPTWTNPIGLSELSSDCMANFDQNGYDLTPLEELYAEANGASVRNVRWRKAIFKDWFNCDSASGVHLNHASLFERKGYSGDALTQIYDFAKTFSPVYKLVHMRPKWGIDISIDYADADKAFEVFHYEWDDFDYSRVVDKQHQIESVIASLDWQDLANKFWQMRDQWLHLDFYGQTKFKTDYLNLEPERFKLVTWTLG